MEALASSSLGAMAPLLRKLDSLLCPDRRLPKPLEDRIELLKEDLEELSSALLEQSMADSPNHKAKYWMDEVRELSYEAEDCIDSMMLTHAGPVAKRPKSRSVRRHRVRRVKVSRLFRTRKPCTRIAKIAELRALVREASERHERYQLDDFSSNSSRVFTVHSQVPALYGKVGEYLIGIDDSRNKLTKRLTGDADQQLKVVCICGSAGVGKTTLARRLYLELGARFECQAFVRASRKPDTRRLLGGILSQVQQRPEPSNSFTVQDLIDNLMKYLHDKRYFIVIDDLWETTTWDIVKSAFPEGNNYSRIVTTTESEVIALQCCGYQSDNILEMETLGNHDSAQLFFSIVFGSEHQCPDQLREVSYRIIRKCGGLPLGTIHVAGLLASQTDNSELWHHVQKCLCSNLSTSSTLEEMLKEVLNLCYNSLPSYLKTCLLYLSMYPEGYTMWKVDLLTQWISEGFVTATEENEAEKIAEGYFDELVNRGMIQPEQINHNDEVLSCTVHHTVLDFIMYKSKEGNFITSIDYSQAIIIPSTMVRRLSLHSSSAKYATKMEGVMLSQLRSLFFFGLIRCLPSVVELKLLRVLVLEFWGDHYGHTSLKLMTICSLLHLRYLKVSCDIIVELPAQMRALQFMETLEINARVSAVPLDIIHLPALLHLSLRDEPNLPDGIGQIRSLHTLQYFDLGNNSEGNVLSLGELKNLQDLHLTYSAVQCDERFKRNIVALASSVGKLVNLRSVILVPGALSTPIYHDVSSSVPHPLVFLQSLQRIGLLPPICMFSRLPKCVKQLQKLCYLSIVVRELQRDDMDSVTGLPALTVLSLYVRQPPEQSIIFNTGTFPVLKYFKYMCGVLCLAFQEGALPNLRRLKLGFNAHKAEQYEHFLAGIEHLLNLKEIDGRIGLADGAEEPDRRAAESAFKDAIDKHLRFPSPSYVNVKRVDWIEEEHELRTKVEDSPCEQHEILQKQYGVEVAEEDTENCANSWPTNQIVQKFPENKDLCLNDTQLQDESSARSMNFSSTTASAQGSQSLSTPSSCWTLYKEYTGVPARSPCPGALSSYVLTPGNIKGPALPYPTSSPEDNILHTQGNWVSPIKTGLSNHPAPKVELSSVAGQWEKGKLIGVGTYGCVYEATDRLTGALCAIKEVNIISNDVESVEFFKQEIKSLSQFKHENIVQFYGSDTIEDRFYIYMEYVHPGSINTYIQQHCGVITESLVCDFTRHILRGLAFLHGRNIMHRNIKGSNMLIDVNGVVKLTDFGVTKHLSIIAPNPSSGVHWMAPEMVRATLVKDVSCDLAVDIWSLGCTIMEMLNGKPPWSNLEGAAAMFKILNKDPPIPDNLSHEGKDFLQCCFKRNPAERPTATQLLDHPFIQNSSRYSEQQVEEVIAASCEPSFEGKPTAGEANDARPYESSSALQSTPRTIQVSGVPEPRLTCGPFMGIKVDDEVAVPPFGGWDEGNAASGENYTGIFNRVRNDKLSPNSSAKQPSSYSGKQENKVQQTCPCCVL